MRNKYFHTSILSVFLAFFLISQGNASPSCDGRGNTKENYEQCLKLAKNGNIDAQINVAKLYQTASGTKRDHPTAIMWLKKAAKQGSQEAFYRLAFTYSVSGVGGKDKAESQKWHRKVIELGGKRAGDSSASIAGSYFYDFNYSESLKWYKKSAFYFSPDYVKSSGTYTNAPQWHKKYAPEDYMNALKNVATLQKLVNRKNFLPGLCLADYKKNAPPLRDCNISYIETQDTDITVFTIFKETHVIINIVYSNKFKKIQEEYGVLLKNREIKIPVTYNEEGYNIVSMKMTSKNNCTTTKRYTKQDSSVYEELISQSGQCGPDQRAAFRDSKNDGKVLMQLSVQYLAFN